MTIIEATSDESIDMARTLFKEYAELLGVDLCFQNFEDELANLPGAYAPPSGRLLLAMEDGQLAGCVAMRPGGPEGVCEMKRLFLRPGFRGKGRGRQLAQAIIESARQAGHKRMRLDTMSGRMSEAVALYESLGFREIEPYYASPIADTKFMELDLDLPTIGAA